MAEQTCPTPYWHKTHRYCPNCDWTEPATVEPSTVRPDLDEAAITSANLAFIESPKPTAAGRMREAVRAYLYTVANVRDGLYPSWNEVRTYLEEARNA
ncbi:hypothetical protein [Nocardia tengchongensis]|uniref:hypothetical protein n=1 Tax=Nocardia tengchongensis TaxID=2055889 RepID=UPI0036499BF8